MLVSSITTLSFKTDNPYILQKNSFCNKPLCTKQMAKIDLFQKSYTKDNIISFGQVLTSNSEMNRAITREIFKQIKKAKKIALFIHKNPDSDCLGSAIMLKKALDGIFNGEKIVQVFSDFISEELRESHGINEGFARQASEEPFDLGIALDCASSKIICNPELFQRCEYKINIDHHKTNTNLTGEKFADLFLVDPEYISTTQLIYEEFFNKVYGYQKKHPVDKVFVEQAAIGLEVDRLATNDFGHELANETVRKWIEKYHIDMKTIWERVKSQLKLTISETQLYGSILDKTKINNGIAYTVISDIGNPDINVERIVIKVLNTLMEAKDVDAAIIFCQKNDCIKVNLRGKTIDVGEIAKKFGGGGHKSASGFIIKSNIDEVVDKVLQEAGGRAIT